MPKMSVINLSITYQWTFITKILRLLPYSIKKNTAFFKYQTVPIFLGHPVALFVERWKSGYFSVMKYFGFIILTWSVDLFSWNQSDRDFCLLHHMNNIRNTLILRYSIIDSDYFNIRNNLTHSISRLWRKSLYFWEPKNFFFGYGWVNGMGVNRLFSKENNWT